MTSAQDVLARYAKGARDFSGEDLSGINLSGALLKDVVFDNADLRSAVLDRANLRRSSFKGAQMQGADLTGADLEEAKLQDARLTGAFLQAANLKKANLEGAELEGTRLIHADLRGAAIAKANLKRASLHYAQLQDAFLYGSDLSGAKLITASFQDANLSDANLTGAELKAADLSGAFLLDAKGARLDETKIRGAHFTHGFLGLRAPVWMQLRASYTGARTLFHLLFLVAFLLPKVSDVLLWLGVNRAQTIFQTGQATIFEQIERLRDSTPQVVRPALDTVRAQLQRLTPCAAERCQGLPVWKLMLGTPYGLWTVIATALLLLYNGVRFVLTARVSALREDEEFTGYAPSYNSYKWLGRAHHFVYLPVFVFAIVFLVVHLLQYLTTQVLVPAAS